MTRNTKILILSGCLVFLALSILTINAVSAQELYRLNRSGSAEAVKTVNTYGAVAPSDCRIVTNTAADIDYMVPYKTPAEWYAFIYNKPASVTLASCCAGCFTAGTCQAGGGCSGGNCIAVTNIPAGTDPNGHCTAVYNSCNGTNRIGPDGNCNGSAACNSGGLSSDCGGDYWADSYQCSGTQPQRLYHSRGCSAGSCYDNASWQNYGSACATAGTCQTGGGCSGGNCIAVTNIPAGTDPNGHCTAVYNSCNGTNRIGPDGNCNGSAACNTGGLSSDCGGNYWTDSYTCSGTMLQRLYHSRGCSAGSCYDNASWENYTECGGGYWVENYSCAGAQPVKLHHSQGCSGSSCYDTTSWENWGNTCATVGVCQTSGYCSGGSCVGAAFVSAGTDPNGDCTAGVSCSGTTAIGPDGYCDGRGSCNTGGYSYDCDATGGWWYGGESCYACICSGEQPQDIWCYYGCSGGNCNGSVSCYYKNRGAACPVVGPFLEWQCSGNDRQLRFAMYGCGVGGPLYVGGDGQCYSDTGIPIPWNYWETCPTAGACQTGGGCSGGSCNPVVADTTSCNCLSDQSSCQSANCYWHSYGYGCSYYPCGYYWDYSGCQYASCYWDSYNYQCLESPY